MKKILGILILLGGAAQAAPADTMPAQATPVAPLAQQAQAAKLSAEILTRNHYKKVPLDDALSAKIFDRFLKDVDGEKLYLMQSDIDNLAGVRTRLDDAIYHDDLQVPFAIFNLYQKRVFERLAYSSELLKKGFDFSENETYEITREKAAWPASQAALRDLWRKRAKSDWLRLKLAGSNDKTIRTTLAKRYEHALTGAKKIKSDDVFQLFMNAYTMSIEPHTNYLGAKASEEFDISMRLSLFGIGAVLSENEEYTTIRELVAGGPAALSNKLKVGDRIVKVGEAGANAVLTDVVGWRISDVVDLIRGNKGTQVSLEVLPAAAGVDGKTERVTLIRDKINIAQQAAKKSIIQTKAGGVMHRVGVISLPVFYLDFDARRRGDPEAKSATKDVARLLEELKKENVDSVLIDLRNNGGGALSEAVELTGLFTGKGPVVQERNSQGAIRVETADKAPVWDKPVGVLINRGSASASEIFAAAIQDYGRGVIIGETSFGKGTVQTLVNLDQLVKSDKPRFGELKMTIAQFFRVNGGTTQLRGVVPDIRLPSTTDGDEYGESSYGNALPWAQIPAATYRPAGDLTELLPMMKIRHDARIGQDKDFAYLMEDIAEVQAKRKANVISLNETIRRKERDTQEARTKLRESRQNASDKLGKKTDKASVTSNSALSLQDDGLQSNERDLITNLAFEKARKDAKDIYLNEAAEILGDEVELMKAGTRLAGRPQAAVQAPAVQKPQ